MSSSIKHFCLPKSLLQKKKLSKDKVKHFFHEIDDIQNRIQKINLSLEKYDFKQGSFDELAGLVDRCYKNMEGRIIAVNFVLENDGGLLS